VNNINAYLAETSENKVEEISLPSLNKTSNFKMPFFVINFLST
jgi:hypothetical protein